MLSIVLVEQASRQLFPSIHTDLYSYCHLAYSKPSILKYNDHPLQFLPPTRKGWEKEYGTSLVQFHNDIPYDASLFGDSSLGTRVLSMLLYRDALHRANT